MLKVDGHGLIADSERGRVPKDDAILTQNSLTVLEGL